MLFYLSMPFVRIPVFTFPFLMAELPEIPEAADPFEKRVALTIAILAVILSFIGNLGDNAKTEAILKTNEASNKWGYFQAKSIKGQMSRLEGDLLLNLSPSPLPDKTREMVEKLKADSERYDHEKGEIKEEAEHLVAEAKHESDVNEHCDRAALFLQIGVVICSVSILSGWKPFWLIGLGLGIVGAAFGIGAFTL
jgi:hypothetical protein